MPGGTVMTVGHGSHAMDAVRERLTFHSDPAKGEFRARNLCVKGDWSSHFSDYTGQLDMIRNGLPLAGLITATYPIEQYEEAYRCYMGGLEGKVVLTHQVLRQSGR